MKLVCATHNENKLREIRQILSPLGFEILSEKDVGFEGDVEETGSTFEENSFIKADAICSFSGMAAIADDSGVVVDALNGAPGVYSARYGGFDDDGERNLYLLRNLSGVEASKRTAKFVSCVTCVFPDGDKLSALGECPGSILFEPRGSGGFGYDPVFLLDKLPKTMAELTPEEKNQVSHRAAALRKLKTELEKYIDGTDR